MSVLNPSDLDPNRLPLNVKPTHYDVTIKTDLEKLTFEGFTKISLDVKEDTLSIVLNCAGLSFQEVSLTSEAAVTEQKPSRQSIEGDRLFLTFDSLIPANSKAELKIGPYSAPLGDSLTGYYRSSYQKDGKPNYYALTQFEAIDARRAFPCWDEPLLKATFAITMISRSESVNLSNMPAYSEKVYAPGSEDALEKNMPSLKALDSSWKITKFDSTPPMSTYLVAYANGPFNIWKTRLRCPAERIFLSKSIYLATPELLHQAQFALDVKKKVLPLYEEIFDVEFPLPKLDTLVVHDFDAGAMENWGLITGRTTAFLLDPKTTDTNAKKNVFTTQSHEVAHMWFGNITTMEWWDYLYLNEGFATLMGEVIVAVFPEFKPKADFISDHLNAALALDAKPSSHPIEVQCPNADSINQIFDSLSYSKAGSVLRMLSDYVGEDRFLKGVSIYLKSKLYGNGVTEDLWKGISAATGQDIVHLMENWIKKIGFPVITVSENNDGIEVRQDRFMETGIAEPEENKTLWNVPLNILSVDKSGKSTIDRSALLEERSKTFTLDTSKPFKLNGGTAGVYRVLYTPERLSKIGVEAAKPDSCFSIEDRMGLVYDSLALSKAGLQKLSSALNLIDNLRNEKEFLILDAISGNLAGLVSTWWEYPEIVDNLNAFRRSIFVPLVDKLGYDFPDSEPTDITRLRSCVVGEAAAAKDEGVIKELRARFDYFKSTGNDSKIPAGLQRVIYGTAVKYGGREEYDSVKQLVESVKTPTSKLAAMIALGQTQDPALIQETFDYLLTSSRDQDFVYFLRGLSSNFKSRRQTAQVFKDNYAQGSFTALSTQKDYDETKSFFQDKDVSKFNLSLAQTLDTIGARIAYLERSSDDLGSWLKEWRGRA
ncbi:leucyl aminopeptidase [Mucidula mucida]|nr:leucyl aminopeptidase [Mucidula mucida]